MSDLIRLCDVPYSARKAEAVARRAHLSRAAALTAAKYELVTAPGCHGRPYFDPPSVGWVLTRAAAEALAARLTHMPGGTSHCRLAVRIAE